METNYRKKNRGYQQLRVWQDAIDLYVLSCRVLREMPFELKRVASQGISSADSVHRNIAEGKQDTGDWIEHLIIKESNIAYGRTECDPIAPPLQYSITPPLHQST